MSFIQNESDNHLLIKNFFHFFQKQIPDIIVPFMKYEYPVVKHPTNQRIPLVGKRFEKMGFVN